ncbi:hypothetical protein B1A85_19465 [Chroococcidiopsis sp. TS-821]|nr:hypothetical protein B1A85_19465 [Chroococcidiopsis sp. TS-821]
MTFNNYCYRQQILANHASIAISFFIGIATLRENKYWYKKMLNLLEMTLNIEIDDEYRIAIVS